MVMAKEWKLSLTITKDGSRDMMPPTNTPYSGTMIFKTMGIYGGKMTTKQKELQKRLIQKIHTSERYTQYLKYDRDAYEALLHDHFGVQSSKEMDIDQLLVFVDFLNQKREDIPIMIKKGTATQPQRALIKELWGQVAENPSDEALREMIYRITKKRYLHVDSISKKDAQIMIPVLKKMKDG